MTPNELVQTIPVLRKTTFGRTERSAQPASTIGTRGGTDEASTAALHALPLRVVPRERLPRFGDDKSANED